LAGARAGPLLIAGRVLVLFADEVEGAALAAALAEGSLGKESIDSGFGTAASSG
jgi:hypothetical protein